MKRALVITALILTVLPACSSHKVKPVDEPLDVKGKMGDTEIGMNKDDQAVVQDQVAVEDELRTMTWKNYEAERKIKQNREDLIQCRTDLADPRLGGNKKLDSIPDLAMKEDMGKQDEKIGLTQTGRIKVVKKQFLDEKIEKQREWAESLDKVGKEVEQQRVDCERDLGYKRVEHGLPADRYPALGYYGPQGNFVVTRPAEHTLDDAFKILADQTRKGKKLEKKESVGPIETGTGEKAIEEEDL
ncbi:MAG: hypothetical protein ACXWP1_00985 [Bdellovibrionota bacterium]